MFQLKIPEIEYYNEQTSMFFTYPSIELNLEHSLVSLSKWESFYEKPFITTADKTPEEFLAYANMMILDDLKGDQNPIKFLRNEDVLALSEYIQSNQTATWFNERPGSTQRNQSETVTAEIMYYWMVAHSIPFECQYWHLNRLITLVKVCNLKQEKPKKMSRRDVMSKNAALNAQRRAAAGSKG